MKLDGWRKVLIYFLTLAWTALLSFYAYKHGQVPDFGGMATLVAPLFLVAVGGNTAEHLIKMKYGNSNGATK